MCTTLNISLNHKDEQMFMGVEYNDWNYVSTPDLGELRKKSTFMDITSPVTTHDMAAGFSFVGRYVKQDADITMLSPMQEPLWGLTAVLSMPAVT